MKFLVRHAAGLIAPNLEGGVCIDNPVVLKRINEATMRLLDGGDHAHTLDQVNFFTKQNSITLPREYEALRLANMCKTPVPITSQAYEFVSSGPGQCDWNKLPQLIDLGTGFLTQWDIPGGTTDWRLLAYGFDNDKTLSWKGKRADGADFIGAQTLPINKWDGTTGAIAGMPTGYSEEPVARITGIQLPTGLSDYVSLFAYDVTTHQMYNLSRYHPSEILPSYRRFRLPWYDATNGVCVSLLCKKRYLPATSLDDELLVQNLSAIKLEVMAIESETSRDVNGAVAYSQLAERQLQRQQSNLNKGVRMEFVGWNDSSDVNII